MNSINTYINERLVSLEAELEETGIESEVDFIQGMITALMEFQIWLGANNETK